MQSIVQGAMRYKVGPNAMIYCTLSEYLRSKLIPRGLRIQKAPTLGYRDQAFCTKCCEI